MLGFRTITCCAFVLLTALASRANADVVWHWQFGTESGTFVTDGAMADTSAPGTFTISQFTVEASNYPGATASTYNLGSQLPEGMIWDGSAPTQFFRDGYTNGANFYGNSPPNYFYGMLPANGYLYDSGESQLLSAPLTVTPIGNVTAAASVPVPVLNWVGLLLLAILLSGVAITRPLSVRPISR